MSYPRNYSLINLNTKINRVQGQVAHIAGQLNTEYKYHDTTGSLSPDSTGDVYHFTDIDQGDGVTNRDGNQIKVVSLYSKYYGSKHASATNTFVRLIWFIDCEQDGTNPTVAEVLETVNPHSHMQFDWRRRFVILADRVIGLGDHTTFHGEFFKKLSHPVSYSSNIGTDSTGNHLYLLYLSNESTNKPTLFISTRLRFLDN